MFRNIGFKIKKHLFEIFSSITNIVFLLAIIFIAFQILSTNDKVDKINEDLTNTKTELEQKISDIELILVSNQEKNTTLEELLAEAQEKSQDLEQRFERVNDNVDELEKITRTDPELLQKYSKIFFLNEHYVPEDLETIPSKYTYDANKKYEIHSEVWPYLEDLLRRADRDGIDLKIISAFRSFGEQAQLKGAYTVTYGSGTANQFSADQGYSEHQLGTTVDFTNTQVGATFSGFAQTEEYKWLRENAHKYGFVLSYPENNNYYQFEPWHWRFVGKDLADDLYDDGEYFYDMNQRDIDEYIVKLFD